MGEYKQLKVWNKSMRLAADIYRVTRQLPSTETFGLVIQLRRAAVSIPSNIAEGAGRGSDADFRRFVAYAYGSLLELETQLLLVCELQLLGPKTCASLLHAVAEVGKMLNGLRTHLKTDD